MTRLLTAEEYHALMADIDREIAEAQDRMDEFDERDAIRREHVNSESITKNCFAILRRPEKFSGEHELAREWLRENAPTEAVLIKRHGRI